MQAFWFWSCFAEKVLLVDPYFQYFSSGLLYQYQLDLPEHLEHAWLITLSFQSTTAKHSQFKLIPLLYYDVTK